MVAQDLWSLGVILFVLLGAYSPFDPEANATEATLRGRVLSGAWDFSAYPGQWKHVSETAKDVRASTSLGQPPSMFLHPTTRPPVHPMSSTALTDGSLWPALPSLVRRRSSAPCSSPSRRRA